MNITIEETTAPNQYSLFNDFSKIMEWKKEYLCFSGYFGIHGPHVFAAAPELLEALETLCPFVMEDYYPNCATPAWTAAVEKMNAAILKAKGQTP